MEKKKYYRLVWEQGKKDTSEYYHKDKRGWTYNIGSAILIAIISPIIYGAMGLIMPSQFWLSVLAGVISGAIFLLLWRIGAFIFYLYNAPEKLYREMETEAYKRSWRNIEIIPFRFPEDSGFGVGLQFISDKPVEYDVSFVTIEITNVVQNAKEIYNGRMYVDLLHGENSAFRNRDQLAHRRYLKGNYVVAAPIAKWNNDIAYIEADDETGRKEIVIEKDAVCNLFIVLRGKLDVGSNNMDVCTVSSNLLYHQDVNGQMLVSLDLVREPKYEL